MPPDLGAFAVAMRRRGEEVEKGTLRAIREGFAATGAALVFSTPVDTGHARGNWQASVGIPAVGEVNRQDPSGATTLAEIVAVANVVNVEHELFLVNNVPYIDKLNAGSSPQQPAGWIERALLVGSAVVEVEGSKLFRR